MDAATRQLVRQRAGFRCEYCRLPEASSGLRYHVDHILPRQHGGGDAPANLALACPHCNLCKGPNLAANDPDTGKTVPLFNPREHSWDDHFEFRDGRILGKSPSGRATVGLLQMNTDELVQLRQRLFALGVLW